MIFWVSRNPERSASPFPPLYMHCVITGLAKCPLTCHVRLMTHRHKTQHLALRTDMLVPHLRVQALTPACAVIGFQRIQSHLFQGCLEQTKS